jgi:hypothetical protein
MPKDEQAEFLKQFFRVGSVAHASSEEGAQTRCLLQEYKQEIVRKHVYTPEVPESARQRSEYFATRRRRPDPLGGRAIG